MAAVVYGALFSAKEKKSASVFVLAARACEGASLFLRLAGSRRTMKTEAH
jgi:hypothetical protein